jgi:hypothetical protein
MSTLKLMIYCWYPYWIFMLGVGILFKISHIDKFMSNSKDDKDE